MEIQNGNGAPLASTAPIIVLTAARSGSTLLRFILDTHPDIACSPETGLGGVCTHLTRFLGVLDGLGISAQPGQGAITADAEATIIQLLNESYGRYLGGRGKRRWCDKSLDNVHHADLLATLFPRAQFICLSRHCMDVIASGVEACAWGLHGFGFDPYSAQYPGNDVAAIAAYWAESTMAILQFEKDYPDRCHHVRYEDLVADPEGMAADIFKFLGEREIPGITEECFRADHEATGPGDEKIWFTGKVEDKSVGRGVTVPVEMLLSPMRAHINGLLQELGYRRVNEDWNQPSGSVDPRAVFPNRIPAVGAALVSTAPPPPLPWVAELIAGQSGPLADARRQEVRRRWPRLAGKWLRALIADAGEQQELRWYIPSGEPALDDEQLAGPAMGETTASLAGDASIWHAVLTGVANMAVAIRTGRLRWSSESERAMPFTDEAYAIGVLLALSEARPAFTGTPGNGDGSPDQARAKELLRVGRDSDFSPLVEG
jgi:hypothetical protein